jgi:TetR/AcrR family transcriptional regulator, transcriptional repressor for nem operon
VNAGGPPAGTRERLVGAAMELFWEKGYGSTSIADILGRAGANAGSLYHFFPTKQDLLLEVLDAYHRGIGPMLLEPAWQGVEDPIERVFALLARYRQLIELTDCAYGCPIGSLALELHEPDRPVRERLADNFTAWVTAVEGCYRAAPLRAEVDRRRLAEFTLTTMEGAVMLTRTHRDAGYFDRAIAELRVHVDALVERSPPRRARGNPPLVRPPRSRR